MRAEVVYWINTSDGYDNRYITTEGEGEDECLEKAREDSQTRRGKDFSIHKTLSI